MQCPTKIIEYNYYMRRKNYTLCLEYVMERKLESNKIQI